MMMSQGYEHSPSIKAHCMIMYCLEDCSIHWLRKGGIWCDGLEVHVLSMSLPTLNSPSLSLSLSQRLAEPGLMTCVYWEDRGMEYENGTKGRHWSVNGCWVVFSDENYTVCSCSHLSTFALIMQTGEVQALCLCGL